MDSFRGRVVWESFLRCCSCGTLACIRFRISVPPTARGWLVLNVEAHDFPGDMPKAFSAALPTMFQNYSSIYDFDRDRNYFTACI